MNTSQTEWLRIKALYEAAIDEWGYTDVRTVALEELEAEACDAYLVSQEVR
jgi:hypothetical protein